MICAERIASQYGVARTYADLEEALGDSHDAAVIATPAHLHIPMATTLCEAGLHLLIEKPLSTGPGGDRYSCPIAGPPQSGCGGGVRLAPSTSTAGDEARD